MVVVLPEPFGPRKPKTMPFGTSRLRWSTARTLPKSRVRFSVRMAILFIGRSLYNPVSCECGSARDGGTSRAFHYELRIGILTGSDPCSFSQLWRVRGGLATLIARIRRRFVVQSGRLIHPGEQDRTMRLEIPGRPKPYVMGHRGNMAHRPENTLASFRLAIEQGVDLIETDLHVTADGEFVCIHASTVARTTNGSGAVGEMTLAEIKRLNAWNGFAGYENERVPTLAEAIEVLPPGIILALELKDDAFLKPEVGRRLAALLDETGMTERTVL